MPIKGTKATTPAILNPSTRSTSARSPSSGMSVKGIWATAEPPLTFIQFQKAAAAYDEAILSQDKSKSFFKLAQAFQKVKKDESLLPEQLEQAQSKMSELGAEEANRLTANSPDAPASPTAPLPPEGPPPLEESHVEMTPAPSPLVFAEPTTYETPATQASAALPVEEQAPSIIFQDADQVESSSDDDDEFVIPLDIELVNVEDDDEAEELFFTPPQSPEPAAEPPLLQEENIVPAAPEVQAQADVQQETNVVDVNEPPEPSDALITLLDELSEGTLTTLPSSALSVELMEQLDFAFKHATTLDAQKEVFEETKDFYDLIKGSFGQITTLEQSNEVTRIKKIFFDMTIAFTNKTNVHIRQRLNLTDERQVTPTPETERAPIFPSPRGMTAAQKTLISVPELQEITSISLSQVANMSSKDVLNILKVLQDYSNAIGNSDEARIILNKAQQIFNQHYYPDSQAQPEHNEIYQQSLQVIEQMSIALRLETMRDKTPLPNANRAISAILTAENIAQLTSPRLQEIAALTRGQLYEMSGGDFFTLLLDLLDHAGESNSTVQASLALTIAQQCFNEHYHPEEGYVLPRDSYYQECQEVIAEIASLV